MKHVVSVSLGSSSRDKTTEVEFLGEKVLVQRIGTDGDQKLARQKYLELDGKVDCFGIGGCELGVPIGKAYYRLRAVQKLVRGLKSPFVDGFGIRKVVEGNIAQWLDGRLERPVKESTVMFCVAAGRYPMVESFHRIGSRLMLCDAGFLLNIPLYTRFLRFGLLIAHIWGPLISRLPFSVLYPTGSKQTQIKPRFTRWFRKADIIADDFHYIRRNLPDDLSNKTIVTNTTTEQDLQTLKDRNLKSLCTTTPRFQGRSFGTNVLEAMLTAIAEEKRLDDNQIRSMLDEAAIQPELTNF